MEPFSHQLIQTLVHVQNHPKQHFDSADWAMSLHGILEYPLNTPPRPMMMNFSSKGQLALVAHPMHEKALSGTGALEEIALAADTKLRAKYGDKTLSKQQVLKLKIRGRTPRDGKEGKSHFDSADWALQLKNTVLAAPEHHH